MCLFYFRFALIMHATTWCLEIFTWTSLGTCFGPFTWEHWKNSSVQGCQLDYAHMIATNVYEHCILRSTWLKCNKWKELIECGVTRFMCLFSLFRVYVTERSNLKSIKWDKWARKGNRLIVCDLIINRILVSSWGFVSSFNIDSCSSLDHWWTFFDEFKYCLSLIQLGPKLSRHGPMPQEVGLPLKCSLSEINCFSYWVWYHMRIWDAHILQYFFAGNLCGFVLF